jgi:rhodanese-related sulfurtransferase
MKRPQSHNDIKVVALGIGLIVVVLAISFGIPLFQHDTDEESVATRISSSPDETQAEFLPSEEAVKLLNDRSAVVFDFRSDADFYTEHIVDARNLSPETLSSNIVSIKKEESEQVTFLFVGYPESSALLEQMRTSIRNAQPDQQIFILAGGFDSWKEKGYPTIRAGDPTNPADQSKISYISKRDALAKIATDRSLIVVDVREKNSYEKDHINISRNIPLAEIESRHNELSLNQPILVYGENALESFQAGVRLFDLGFFRVETLDGSYPDLVASPE